MIPPARRLCRAEERHGRPRRTHSLALSREAAGSPELLGSSWTCRAPCAGEPCCLHGTTPSPASFAQSIWGWPPSPSPSPSSACGSSTSSSPAAPSTTSPASCASGPLDVAALERSLRQLVRRHEALRTTSPARGEPVQVIHPPRSCSLPVVDLGALPAERRDARPGGCALDGGAAPFDLGAGPLLRATLLRLDARRPRARSCDAPHRLRRLVHGRAVREMAGPVRGLRRRARRRCPSCPSSTRTSPAGSSSGCGGEVLERQLAYWSSSSPGAPAALELPTDRPRPACSLPRRAPHVLLPAARSRTRLQALGQQQGATPFMVLLAAFAGPAPPLHRPGRPLRRLAHRRPAPGGARRAHRLLRQHPGPADDLAGRSLLPRAAGAGARDHAGRLRPSGRPLRAARRGAAARTATWPHAALPGRLRPPERRRTATDTAGVEADASWTLDPGTSKFDLTLELLVARRWVPRHVLKYSTDLFTPAPASVSPATARAPGGALAAPDSPLATLPLLPPAERPRCCATSTPPTPTSPRDTPASTLRGAGRHARRLRRR